MGSPKYLNMIHAFLMALSLCSCSNNGHEYDMHDIVVEGWIDNGQNPVVIITKSLYLQINSKIEINDSYVGTGAVVKVSCEGGDTAILEGKTDTHYLPPYIYTTDKITGQAGKTYSLCVELDQYRATAQTVIPLEQAVIDSFRIEPSADSDSLLSLSAFVSNPNKCRYMSTFIAAKPDANYLMNAYMGTYKDQKFEGGSNIIELNKPYKSIATRDIYYSDFNYGDSVTIKFSGIDSLAYEFWNNIGIISTIKNNTVTGDIKNAKGNISGGLGYWFGYNSSIYTLILPEKKQIQ